MDVPGCEVITLPVEKTSRSCPRQTRAPGVPQKGVRGVPNPREKVKWPDVAAISTTNEFDRKKPARTC